MTLEQNDDRVTGSGTRGGSAESVAITVSGTAKDDDIALRVESPNLSGSSYRAKLDGDTMNGTWTEPLIALTLTLRRK